MNDRYKLLSVQAEEHKLFFRLDSDPVRFGTIGHLRGDFDSNGIGFYTTWFDNQKHLKTEAFKKEFDNIVNYLRGYPDADVLKNRRDMETYFYAHPEHRIEGGWNGRMLGFKIQTPDFTHYVRYCPQKGDYDFYIFSFDNRFLLPELAGQHELPNECFAMLPSSGNIIFIISGEQGYHSSGLSTNDQKLNRQTINLNNALMGVTRAQEEAMLAGSLFGWDKPAAKPWNYEADGTPRNPNQPKKKEPER